MRIINIRTSRPPKEFYVYCGRPSALGNPYNIVEQSRAVAIRRYEEHLRNKIINRDIDVLNQLRLIIAYETEGGCTLGCWCAPMRCHCEIIIKLINELKEEICSHRKID